MSRLDTGVAIVTERKQPNRERIVAAANRLFYVKGYNQTSFADVADELGISKGNLHYHFRSKNDLLDAVIALRIGSIEQMLARWQKEYPDGKDRLTRYVRILLNEQTDVVRYGCPMGSLNMELAKDQRDLQQRSLEMFELFRHWLEKAFRQMGRRDFRALSLHVMARTQGAAMIASVYADAGLLKAEYKRLLDWIEAL
jgi:AcrR family transcriptional regulator